MPEKPSIVPLLVMIAVVVIAGAIGGSYVYFHSLPQPGGTPFVVRPGDNVTVNYIGIFGSGAESGKVFDTSLYRVASDNVAYPKSLEYHGRGVAANYTTLAVHVGGSTPSSGYTLGNFSFIQVVPGFWQGLVGIPPNQTHTIIVPPDLGYGPTNPACVATFPLTQNMPIVRTFSGAQFQKAYPGAIAATGSEFSDPHYGWTVMVLAANASFVTIENLPTLGESASPSGWPVTVTAIASTANGSGTITLVNQLTAADAGHLLGKDFLGTGPCSSSANGQFIVSSVDPAKGTYTENFNPEVQGQTLIFIVTVVDVFVPPPPVA
ncbi:MAG: hypothetical protein ACREDK_01485 [Thermoplasmata archaeon]